MMIVTKRDVAPRENEFQSAVTLEARSGTNYFIFVDGVLEDSGNFVLNFLKAAVSKRRLSRTCCRRQLGKVV